MRGWQAGIEGRGWAAGGGIEVWWGRTEESSPFERWRSINITPHCHLRLNPFPAALVRPSPYYRLGKIIFDYEYPARARRSFLAPRRAPPFNFRGNLWFPMREYHWKTDGLQKAGLHSREESFQGIDFNGCRRKEKRCTYMCVWIRFPT